MFRKRSNEQPADTGEDARYGDELLSANWNPVVDLLAHSAGASRDHASREQTDRSDVDIEGFLNRVYTLGA